MFKGSGKPADNRVSIDLGGFYTRIFHHSEGLILDEPTIGLLNMESRYSGSRAVNYFGADALTAAQTNTGRIMRPLQADCQNNVGYSSAMLRYLFSKLRRENKLGKSPVVLLSVPEDITRLVTEDLMHALFAAGASRVHLVDNAITTALGADLTIEDYIPRLLLDLGARSVRLYAYQGNEVTAAYALPYGGDMLDEALTIGIRERYGVHVSSSEAQQAKHRVGSARPASFTTNLQSSVPMQGRQVFENRETNFTLTSEVACQLLQPALSRMADAINAAMQSMPYQFRDAQRETSITITGGGSQLARIDQLVMEAADRPVEIAGKPMSATVRGAAKMLNRIHNNSSQAQPA